MLNLHECFQNIAYGKLQVVVQVIGFEIWLYLRRYAGYVIILSID